MAARHLSKTFAGNRVVTDVTLEVRPGTVHALLGGNGSGKSTLLKMLAGVYSPDPGGQIIAGEVTYPSHRYTPTEAAAAGLRFVHQDLGLVDTLSIAENIALVAGYPRRVGVNVDWRRVHAAAATALNALGMDFDPRRMVGSLRPADRALVAIARALRDSGRGRSLVLVLDEPTASLPHDEVDRLFAALRGFRSLGHSIIYVSHRLSEVMNLADRVTVLRDGRVTAEGATSEFDEAAIVELMSGVAHPPAGPPSPPGAKGSAERPCLRVLGLAAGHVRVSFDLRPREVVGLAGLVGSGRSTILRALFGDLAWSGVVELAGVPVQLRRPSQAMAAGFAYVPEHRARDATFAERPVWENLSAAVIGTYRRLVRLDRRAERRDAGALMGKFLIRAHSDRLPLAALSGGNQQKVVLARWLRREPTVLLLDEPSQGVDAAARIEIHTLIRRQVAAGGAALVASSDFEELESLCDRVLVLREGRLIAELTGDHATAARLTELTQTDPEGSPA